MINLNEILAYREIKNRNYLKKKFSFNTLINLSNKCIAKIYDDLKIYMVLSIKWHFDYLAKTRRNPNELNLSIRFWFNILSIFKDFEKLGWINLPNKKKINADIWINTRKAFNFMWPKNTNKKKYNASKVMVDLRVNQFMKMINKDKKYFKNQKLRALIDYNTESISVFDSTGNKNKFSLNHWKEFEVPKCEMKL